MTSREREVWRVLHDMKHWILAIINLLETEGQEAALLSLQELLKKLTGTEREFSEKEGAPWEIFLEEKLKKVAEHKIRVIKKVAPGRYHEMPWLDFSAVLGNLLDNAIEALIMEKTVQKQKKGSEDSDAEPFLEIRMREKCRFLYLYVCNSCTQEIKTEKKDGQVHGMGLLNVAETVKKYHGKLYTRKEKDLFTAEVIMLIPEAKENIQGEKEALTK